MATWVILLRGINVGGKNVLPMQDLRTSMAGAGFANVRTYIQSGNVVAEHAEPDSTVLANAVSALLLSEHGIEAPVFALSKQELEAAASANPYAAENPDPKSVHLMFLSATPSASAVTALQPLAADSEDHAVIGSTLYLKAPDGIARSKLAAGAERALAVGVTARNLRTVQKLVDMVQ